MGGYVLGNVLTSIVAIILNYILLRILGVPYALVLSVFVGLADLVPLVGSEAQPESWQHQVILGPSVGNRIVNDW